MLMYQVMKTTTQTNRPGLIKAIRIAYAKAFILPNHEGAEWVRAIRATWLDGDMDGLTMSLGGLYFALGEVDAPQAHERLGRALRAVGVLPVA